MLQAFIDESVDDKVLSMAGYVGTAEKWATFSNEWDRILSASPRIKYFKYSECMRQRGQFHGVSEESAISKMADLYEVITSSAVGYVSAAVNPFEYRSIFGSQNYPKPIRSPYYCCLLTIISKLPGLLFEIGASGPVEFIFDRQVMEEQYILEIWYWLVEAGFIDNNLVRSAPQFKDDADRLPLQAADMLAGRMRAALRENFALVPPKLIPNHSSHRILGGVHFVWRREDLERLRDSMALSERTAVRGMFEHQPFISMKFNRPE
jgi:Protein of unknown function (DUF3800)